MAKPEIVRAHMDAPPLTADMAAQIAAALASGAGRICWTRCYPCQFGECPDVPHTWMDGDEAAHAGATTDEQRAALAHTKPCGCHCMDTHRAPAKEPA